jgi:tagatose 6-phosphate kinase
VERGRSKSPDTYDIIVASPNVAVDSYYVLSTLKTGSINRTEIVFHTAGGKANNLARAAHALGGHVLSLGIVGGYSGKYIVEELARECIPCDMVFADHESRRSSTIISPSQMQTTVILDSGAPIAPAAGESLLKKTILHAPEAPFLVLTGSLPPGLSSDYYAGVIRSVKDFPGLGVCLDCSGPALASAAEAGVKIIKVNVSEYLATFSNDEGFSLLCAQRTF